jgi:RsmE family RNA methyltransferase
VNLIILETGDVNADGEVALSGPRAVHLLDVLDAAPGRTVRVGLLDGPLGIGTVESTSGGVVTLRCTFEQTMPPRPRVDLLLALPRPKVMRRLWAQIAALGVGRIILTNAARVERHYFDTHVLTPGCYRPLLVEGLQQARDTRVPEVSIHRQLKVLVEDHLDAMVGEARRLVAQPGPARSVHAGVGAVMSQRPAPRALLAVGPEGGWTDYEIARFEAHGFEPVGMGPRALRTDTATIALLALVHAAHLTHGIEYHGSTS